MPGITEGDGNTIGDQKRPAIVDGDELADRLFGIGVAVERFDRRKILFGPLLGNVLRVSALNFRRIDQHDAGQIARGIGAVNISIISLAAEIGKIAAMIDVRMAEYHRVESARIKGEVAIALHRFVAPTLKQSALEEDLLAIDFEKVHGAGGRPGRAEEMNSHGRERRG